MAEWGRARWHAVASSALGTERTAMAATREGDDDDDDDDGGDDACRSDGDCTPNTQHARGPWLAATEAAWRMAWAGTRRAEIRTGKATTGGSDTARDVENGAHKQRARDGSGRSESAREYATHGTHNTHDVASERETRVEGARCGVGWQYRP